MAWLLEWVKNLPAWLNRAQIGTSDLDVLVRCVPEIKR